MESSPGHLHSEATERLRGRSFKLASMPRTHKWPNAPNQSPIIIIREYFGSGLVSFLVFIPST